METKHDVIKKVESGVSASVVKDTITDTKTQKE